MKRILSIAVIILAFSLCLCGCVSEEEFPKPTEKFYVNDFADIIPDSDEANMVEKAAALAEATTAQVVVVTIESLNGYEISDYALEIGREWGVGDTEADNGIVILLSTDDREVYIAVGYGLEGALPDSKTGRIIDVYGLDYFKADNFSNGLISVADAVINEVYIEYGITPQGGYISIDNVTTDDSLSESGGSVAISWVALIIILLIISFLNRRRSPFIWFGGPGSFGGGGFGSGGFHSGGGSSFGGFRGGGGSFGGGGAGRGF